ncbi:MAG: hypothetical protein HWQ38_03110 [Nostoc sp. NMS7]|uniref:hypothetical protein n=1 Tax=Nostoc sp. NMS7 TaxID=2815391 RepID=UPI0025E707F3|nr:hypothetical protein [Nostoc sp. NMS7]MBN3945521.1 hypothetical protein [Nostoc sp. NMS7]
MVLDEVQMDIDFKQFSDYLDYYSSIVEWTKPLSNFIDIYYNFTKIKNFNAKHLAKFAKTLLDYQGNPIVKEDNIKCLSLARDFALSTDPNKRQTYLCTVEQKRTFFDNEDEITIIGKVKLICISDNYLQSVGLYEEQDYKDYLADRSSEVLYYKFCQAELVGQSDRLIQYELIK